jgi:hypothetical protein
MDNHGIINISLCIINCRGMYSKEDKNWILHKNLVLPFVEIIDSFKEYWANAFALVNQTAVPALQRGYGMTTMDNETLLAFYGNLLANFGTAYYAAMQEMMGSQANSLVAMQGQLANIQQFCMTVGQQPPSSIYAPPQQQCMFNNCHKGNGGSQGSGRGFLQQSTMSFGRAGGSQQQLTRPPTPDKHWEIWNYCHTHSSDVNNTHTSATCGKLGPPHNPNASRANTWGRSTA